MSDATETSNKFTSLDTADIAAYERPPFPAWSSVILKLIALTSVVGGVMIAYHLHTGGDVLAPGLLPAVGLALVGICVIWPLSDNPYYTISFRSGASIRIRTTGRDFIVSEINRAVAGEQEPGAKTIHPRIPQSITNAIEQNEGELILQTVGAHVITNQRLFVLPREGRPELPLAVPLSEVEACE